MVDHGLTINHGFWLVFGQTMVFSTIAALWCRSIKRTMQFKFREEIRANAWCQIFEIAVREIGTKLINFIEIELIFLHCCF
jgi:ribosomal protein L20A (L18A)